MSVEHIGMVYAAQGLSAIEKHLLGAYCNHTDAHGYCWPGLPRLLDETGLSKSTIKRANNMLRAKGLIKSRTRFDAGGKQLSNLTRVNIPQLASMRRPDKDYDDNLIEAITFEAEATSNPLSQVEWGVHSEPQILT